MNAQSIHPAASPAPHENAHALFHQALDHHRADRPDDAERLYRAALAADPTHAEALYYLGLLCLNHRGVDEAIACFDRALALKPTEADWLNDRGIAAAALHDHASAAGFYRRALDHAPDHALAHCNLGKALLRLDAIEDARRHFAQASGLDPMLVDAVLGCGTVHELQGRVDEALDCYQRAASLAPSDARPWSSLGHTHLRAHDVTAAVDAFQQTTQRAPGDAEAWHMLARAHQAALDFNAALDAYGHALSLRPHDATLYNNRAFTLTCLSRYDEADADLHRAIELAPALAEPRKLLGMSALRRGDFAAGWRDYEFRKVTAAGLPVYTPLNCPEWQGEPLDGKRILLAREQGAGDQLQFVRYAAPLAALGAHVDVWTSPELATLLGRATGVDRALDSKPEHGYDYWCQVMSVPRYLANAEPPATLPYLFAEPTRVSTWRTRLDALAQRRRKVGLVWAGNPNHQLDAFRSIPLAALMPLASLPGVEWFSLQKGRALAQRDAVAAQWTLHDLGSQFRDYDDCAAAIAALDLVISVDTSVAHLAGALGKPLFVLLPAQADWRWMSGPRTVWYPQAHLFRQITLGDWSDVVNALRAALA